MHSLLEKMGFESSPEIDRSLKRKKEILGISTQREAQLKGSYFEEFDLVENEYKQKLVSFEEGFSADLLCGVINRGDKVTNWMEQLDSLTKMYLFDSKKYSQIDSIFNNPCYELYPYVVKIADKYYIGSDDGKHRLTIAKCIGNKTLPVRLIEYI